MIASFLKTQGADVLVAVKVQPRASRTEIGEALGAELKVKVTAPPVDAAANEALVRFLAETLGCARGAVQIIRGHTSRHKTVRLCNVGVAQVQAALGFGGT